MQLQIDGRVPQPICDSTDTVQMDDMTDADRLTWFRQMVSFTEMYFFLLLLFNVFFSLLCA